MKILFKIKKFTIALLFLPTLVLPVGVYAETSVTPRVNSSPLINTDKGICTRLGDLQTKASNSIGERTDKVDSGRTTRENDLTARRNNVDKQLGLDREKWGGERQEQFAKLEARAKTDAQKAAVATFETTIKNAIATRQAAVDAAISAYRSGVNSLIATRQAAVDAAITKFKSAVSAAFAKAQSDCSSGVDPRIVKTNLQAALKAAREQLKLDIQKATNTQGQLKTLAATRKAAVQSAISTFEATAKAAVAALKAAFGTTSSPSPTPVVTPSP